MSTVAHDTPRQMPRKAALAAFLGSALEYYDFFIYGSAAALVFGTIFFPQGDPTVATIGALATFGVGYVARPLGGIVLGHFGDKLGRKRILLITLVIMGAASLAIGFLPTFERIGYWAPALLVLCRLAQGFSAGGEAAGASSLTLEHSPEGRRGFFTSFTMTGYAAGMVLATLVFIPVAALPAEALYSWGWRVPFWFSVVVLAVAYWVRSKLDETPVFAEAMEADEVSRVPALRVLRTQPTDLLRVAFCALFAVTQTVFTVFGLAYATSEHVGLDRTTMLWVQTVAIGGSIVAIPLLARLSDRVGRRPVWVAGALGCLGTVFLYFWAISTANIALVFVGAILHMTLFYSMLNGLWPSFFTEMFAAPVRYTGFAIGTQVGFLAAGFAPAIGYAIQGSGADGWVPVAVMTAACLLLCGAAGFSARETAFTRLEELGRTRAGRAAARRAPVSVR